MQIIFILNSRIISRIKFKIINMVNYDVSRLKFLNIVTEHKNF